LPITEEDRVYTSQQTISVYAMSYSKFDQELNAFIKVLTEQSLTKSYKQRKRPVGNSQKWSRSPTGAVVYESFQLQSLSDSSNGFLQC